MTKKIDFKAQMKSNVTQSVTAGLISNEAVKQKIIILPEFKNLIQPLQDDEYQVLEKNILDNGCKDSLVIWQTTEQIIDPTVVNNDVRFVLIDGHNRYQICVKHHIPFNIVLMFFASMQEAKNYMLDLQMGRRNLSPTQMAYYRGLRYNNEKITVKTDNFLKDTKDEKTANKIAQQYNVDEKTIRRDGAFAVGLDKLSNELRQDILTGKKKVSKKNIQQLVKLEINTPIDSIEGLDKAVLNELPAPSNTKISKELFNQIKETLDKVYQTNDITDYHHLTSLVQTMGNLILG